MDAFIKGNFYQLIIVLIAIMTFILTVGKLYKMIWSGIVHKLTRQFVEKVNLDQFEKRLLKLIDERYARYPDTASKLDKLELRQDQDDQRHKEFKEDLRRIENKINGKAKQ